MNKGFIMLDSLICVFIAVYISVLCFGIFRSIEKYEQGHDLYIERSDDEYMQIYDGLYYCEPCQIDEFD